MVRRGEAAIAPASGLLRVEGLAKRFGGTVALEEATLHLAAGESLGIVGFAGSGKTTLVDLISGFVRPDRGRVWLAEREITGWPPHRVARAGVGRTFQRPRVVLELTVAQNLEVASLHRRLRGRRRRQIVTEILDTVDLSPLRDREAGTLSPGELRRIELGRALAAAGSVLLLDEPLAALNADDAPPVMSVLRRLRREGRTMLIVAHGATLLQALCDRVVVIAGGRVLRGGATADHRHA